MLNDMIASRSIRRNMINLVFTACGLAVIAGVSPSAATAAPPAPTHVAALQATTTIDTPNSNGWQ